jgi:hypothetical protein
MLQNIGSGFTITCNKNMHRYQSGLMARPAKPTIREFESHPMLQVSDYLLLL